MKKDQTIEDIASEILRSEFTGKKLFHLIFSGLRHDDTRNYPVTCGIFSFNSDVFDGSVRAKMNEEEAVRHSIFAHREDYSIASHIPLTLNPYDAMEIVRRYWNERITE